MSIQFSKDMRIKDEFDSTIPSSSICEKIFKADDLVALGTPIPNCFIQSANRAILIVEFSD